MSGPDSVTQLNTVVTVVVVTGEGVVVEARNVRIVTVTDIIY